MSLEEARSGSMAKRPGVQNKGLAVGFIRTLRNPLSGIARPCSSKSEVQPDDSVFGFEVWSLNSEPKVCLHGSGFRVWSKVTKGLGPVA